MAWLKPFDGEVYAAPSFLTTTCFSNIGRSGIIRDVMTAVALADEINHLLSTVQVWSHNEVTNVMSEITIASQKGITKDYQFM